jgi:cephalosporin-C deacetylase-like acetyl esterase
MDESVEWRDLKYEEVFEQEIRGLSRRRETDPACTVEDLEGVLQHLYIMDGADWYGRGCVQDITMAATIAAYEHFIAQWRVKEQ